MAESSSLIIVSNRLPITVNRKGDDEFDLKISSGGLVAGLREIHEQNNIDWVGHSGVFASEQGFGRLKEQLAELRLIPVPLRKNLYTSYYNGMSNAAIWPLFHYFQSDVKINDKEWEAYCRVNHEFAQTVLDVAKPGDRIWIHDYQLMLLPALLRDSDKDLKIAYFHHIPFPSSEIFRIIPGRAQILRGLLGADFIGFHTYDYVRHFMACVTRILGSDIHVDEIHFGDRLVKVGAFPLGVDFQKIAGISEQLTVAGTAADIVPGAQDKLLFLGIDRLDYTKGIPERLTAFRDFLRDHPEYVGVATLIQLCVPSRTDIQSYGNLRATVERLVGQINGEFSQPGYTPVQYLYRSMPMDEVVSLYKTADVALVTPLRDGLNLVCKEYVAARDDEDGVLILSEFAGSASEMGEALLVNPYDVKDMAHAMYLAATMNEKERKRRMHLLRERVRTHDNIAWANSFMEGWEKSHLTAVARSERLTGNLREEVLQKIAEGRRIFLFIDNDGTLIPIQRRPELAFPDENILALLRRLTAIDSIVPTIVTGRPRSFCEEYYLDLPINVVSEHGAFFWQRDDNTWHAQHGLEELEDLKPDILQLLNMYTRFVPGTHVEHKETCLVWHFRQAEPVFAESQAKALVEALQRLLQNTTLSVYQGKKTIEVRQTVANKGYAVEHVLETNAWQPEDAIVTIGDDTTDEDMHKIQSERNISIHIGKPNVYAKYFLASPDDLAKFISRLIDIRS